MRGHRKNKRQLGSPTEPAGWPSCNPYGPGSVEEAPVNLLPHFLPKSVSSGAVNYESQACQRLTQVS